MMITDNLVSLGILVVLLLIGVSYLMGWSFSAGYHNHKYQHTKRLMQLLKTEGNPQ